MIRLERKNYNTILQQPKYQLYHQKKIGKYEYLTGKEIVPSNQKQIVEQTNFTYSSLEKAFEKQTKAIEDQGKKQVDALKDLKPKEKTKSIEGIFPEGYESVEIKNELNKIKEFEKNVKRNNIIYYSSKEPFDFRIFKTVKSFGKDIYSGIFVTINEADQKQVDLIEYILNFNNKARPKKKNNKKKTKNMFLILHKIFMMVENQLLMILTVDYFH